ncbi:hypothetical protein [Sphingobacterium corticibacterium]|uniref:hypothetical protein n=1 Tax=Sphingobacterium corticibacterium TaxID=2484746 RepID=UPI0013EEC8B5|nr:hypothetical protein [Sphingobacterium corticibacterium]
MKQKKTTERSAAVRQILKRTTKRNPYAWTEMNTRAAGYIRLAKNCDIVLPGMGLV